jgi:hypothetical protein
LIPTLETSWDEGDLVAMRMGQPEKEMKVDLEELMDNETMSEEQGKGKGKGKGKSVLQSTKKSLGYWATDKSAAKCCGCDKRFSILVRKHHCRCCGQIFCEHCTRDMRIIPSISLFRPFRCCEECTRLIDATGQDKSQEGITRGPSRSHLNTMNSLASVSSRSSPIGIGMSGSADSNDDRIAYTGRSVSVDLDRKSPFISRSIVGSPVLGAIGGGELAGYRDRSTSIS